MVTAERRPQTEHAVPGRDEQHEMDLAAAIKDPCNYQGRALMLPNKDLAAVREGKFCCLGRALLLPGKSLPAAREGHCYFLQRVLLLPSCCLERTLLLPGKGLADAMEILFCCQYNTFLISFNLEFVFFFLSP